VVHSPSRSDLKDKDPRRGIVESGLEHAGPAVAWVVNVLTLGEAFADGQPHLLPTYRRDHAVLATVVAGLSDFDRRDRMPARGERVEEGVENAKCSSRSGDCSSSPTSGS
jgi:hypothetical protein